MLIFVKFCTDFWAFFEPFFVKTVNYSIVFNLIRILSDFIQIKHDGFLLEIVKNEAIKTSYLLFVFFDFE